MKALIAIALCGAAAVASAQGTSDNLREIRYSDPRGDTILRYGQPAAKPAQTKPAFAALDGNGDGVIDEREASGFEILANDFEFADRNRDMRVSQREYERW
ncbi:MAG TPA: hypothetical protein VLF18_21495 [Tahibacter sp.]|uniref:hypothetical protein n=1 Tax=Tahibacter sp. TaxID=2056211 RepID=UPI002CF5BB6F|nr:hypothetical protein [Tahibacter sp.]HSX62766.1 hypothetical protein [Tahibacter sp.]